MDPYLDQGTGSSMDPLRKRTARETYWNIRRYSRSIRAYLTEHFPGKRTGLFLQEMYMGCESADLIIADAWQRGGTSYVDQVLDTSDVLENIFSRLAAEVPFLVTGDFHMRDEMRACKTPGNAQIAPDAEIARTRDLAQTHYQQSERVGRKGNEDGDSEGGGKGGARRRNRRGKGYKAEGGADAAQEGGMPGK